MSSLKSQRVMRAVSDFWCDDWPRISAAHSALLPTPSVTSVNGLRA